MTILKLDKEREFAIDLGALKIFEKVSGKSIFDEATFEKMDASTLSDLLYSGLRRKGCELSRDEVDSLITPKNMKRISEQLHEMLTDTGEESTEKNL